jgi:hypothetical protein
MAFTAFPGVEPLQAEVLEALVTEARSLGAVKTSSQIVNGSAVLVNAADLSFSAAANARYVGELVLYYNSGATPDIKFGLTVPSGTTGTWGGLGYDFTPVLLAFGPIDITTALGFGGLSADRAAFIRVALLTSSTAGTVQVQFAQSTSNASNTTLLAGSWIRFNRIS